MKYRDMQGIPTQTERADSRQIENNAGGYVYGVSDANRLRRFLILGAEGGTYYVDQRTHMRDSVQFLTEYADKDPEGYFRVLADVNVTNAAPRHSTVLFALALLKSRIPEPQVQDTGRVRPNGSPIKRNAVHPVGEAIKERFREFVRTGTHMFEFTDYISAYTKGSRGLRAMLSNWYLAQDVDKLAYQVLKYRRRGGWVHRDVLRLGHPKAGDGTLNQVLNYAVNGPTPENVGAARILGQFERVKSGELDPKEALDLSWEMLPTDSLKDPGVWRALIMGKRLPYTAMMRNLGRMTALDVFTQGVTGAKVQGEVVRTLADPENVQRARVHPFNVLLALKTYSEGGGFRGSLTWTPRQPIVDALDKAFRLAFQNVEPTGKRVCIALDISGSMGMYNIMNSNVSAREGSAAMAIATLAADPNTTDTVAFTSTGWSAHSQRSAWGGRDGIEEITLSPQRRLDDNLRTVRNLRMGATDCALPMLWAEGQGRKYDAFVIYTDSETYAGKVQPMEALRQYRKSCGIADAKLIVVGMTSTGFTIADPQDQNALDVVGFDSSAPRIISDFIAGKV
jgi:60 kDa SS-A/Ro ribonucleoprotein